MPVHPIVFAVGVVLLAAAVFDLWRTLRRVRAALSLPVLLLHAFLWPVLIASGVAAIDHATDVDAVDYSQRLLRAAFAFAGAASLPPAPPEGLLLGLTRFAGRIYLVMTAFLIAAVLLQHRAQRRAG